MLLVNSCVTLLLQMQQQIAFTLQKFWKLTQRKILCLFLAIIHATCEIFEAVSRLLRSQMIFEYRPIFGGMKGDVAPIPE